MIKKISSALIKYLLLPALAIFLLYWAFRDTDITQIWQEIKSADYRFVALSFIVGYLAFVLIGLRWLIVLEALGYHKVSPWGSIHSVTLTYIGNLMAPRAGEVIRCTEMKRATGIPASRLFGTVILERILDVFMLGAVALLTFFVQREHIVSFIKKAFQARAVQSSMPDYTFWFIAAGALIFLAALWFVFRKRLRGTRLYKYLAGVIAEIIEGAKGIMKLKRNWAYIGYTLAIWLCYYLMIFFMTFAFEETASLSAGDALYLMCVGSLAQLVPVQGGIGAYHSAIKFGFPILGVAAVTPTVALAFATLTHATQTAMQLTTGIAAFVSLQFTLAGERKSDKHNN